MMRVRLKAIKFDVDFRKTELTNYDTFSRSRSFPGQLSANEVYLFISKSGNQLVWILNMSEVDAPRPNKRGRTNRRMIDSRKWRIEGGTSWSPMMLQNYAQDVGLDLVGFKRFEDLYDERRAA